jgi:hypothetical protein
MWLTVPIQKFVKMLKSSTVSVDSQMDIAQSQPTENTPYCTPSSFSHYNYGNDAPLFMNFLISKMNNQSITGLYLSRTVTGIPNDTSYTPLYVSISAHLFIIPRCCPLSLLSSAFFLSNWIWLHAFARFFSNLGHICILPKIPLFILDQNPRVRMWLNENEPRDLFMIRLKCKWQC